MASLVPAASPAASDISPAKKCERGGTLFAWAYLFCGNRHRGAAMTCTLAQFGLTCGAPSAVVGQTLSDETLLGRIARHEVARYKALSVLRRRKELEASAIADPRDDSEKALQVSERSEALRKGLMKRSPERGEIIDLVDDREKSVREAAIGIPEPAVVATTAAIAHEVKQPLAAMVMSANAGLRWLKRPEPNLDEVQAALERIVRDGHRANEVIANVRAIFGKDRREKTRVNVNTLIGEVLGLIQEELESRRISVRNELIDGLPEVMAERVQLQQALLNLVMNAVDAMSAVTGRERRLTVKSQLDVHGVRIAVEDSGTGIDRGYVDRIFDYFFTTKPYGMGMGLSICRSIIESHGGRLWFSSRSSHGTTFYVQLPAEVENREAAFNALKTQVLRR
jgi:signal transduction histidine kinase